MELRGAEVLIGQGHTFVEAARKLSPTIVGVIYMVG